jgi:hypothetical protein
MDNTHDVSPEMAATLRRYLEVQAEEQRLKEEKTALQEKLGLFMGQRRLSQWFPDLDGQRLKVRCQETTAIEYNEPVLRERLGDRFPAILAPDLKKMRRNLEAIASGLTPFMDLIGAPAPERGRAAIEQGLVRKEEFAGAFRKTTRRLVAVGKLLDQPPAGAAPPPETPPADGG